MNCCYFPYCIFFFFFFISRIVRLLVSPFRNSNIRSQNLKKKINERKKNDEAKQKKKHSNEVKNINDYNNNNRMKLEKKNDSKVANSKYPLPYQFSFYFYSKEFDHAIFKRTASIVIQQK